jgi:hypothetical protein
MPFSPTAKPLRSMHKERVHVAAAFAARLDDLGPISVRFATDPTRALAAADTYRLHVDVGPMDDPGPSAAITFPAWKLMHARATDDMLDELELRIRHVAFFRGLTRTLA